MITENIVLTAAHCNNSGHFISSTFAIAFGIHEVAFSLSTYLLEKGLKGTVFREVKESIVHPKYNITTNAYDFAILILKTPVKMSRKISPVCLPDPIDPMDEILETKNNIQIGFGTSRIWFYEYQYLLKGQLEFAQFIPPEVFNDLPVFLSALQEDGFQRKIIEGYFQKFKELFPGIDECIEDNAFVRELKNDSIDNIVANIRIKLMNSGRRVEEKRLEQFLYFTHIVLKKYAVEIKEYMDNKRNVTKAEKIGGGIIGMVLILSNPSNISAIPEEQIMRDVKYIDQWFFMAKTVQFVTTGINIQPILRKSMGKFLPWSVAESW